MNTFEDLGVGPEITEALAAEGIESPTPLQEAAIPVVRKGNNLILEAGPGSGVLLAWVVGLLERIPAEDAGPQVLVVCASTDAATRLAESTARIAVGLDHRIAALGSGWALPGRSDILFASTAEAVAQLAAGSVSPDRVSALVVEQAQMIEEAGGLSVIEDVLARLAGTEQRILSALPMTDGVADLAARHFKRTVTLPGPFEIGPARGEVRFRICPEPREIEVLRVAEEVLDEGARHVLVYARTQDHAADLGDDFALRGFTAGAPGDPDARVWLAVDALEAREAALGSDGVVVVSADVPAHPDELDRRHSVSADGVIVVLPREVPHLRALGKRTGYGTVPFPPPRPAADPGADLRTTLEEALASEDTAPYMIALEPLLERYDPVELAAAAVALLRRRRSTGTPSESPVRTPSDPTPVPSWAKLFVSVGERDGLRKGDLLGAITGEANVSGDAVGRIDIHEKHTLVEVHDDVARKVIRAVNGTTLAGRSARVDFDRPRRAPARRGRPRKG